MRVAPKVVLAYVIASITVVSFGAPSRATGGFFGVPWTGSREDFKRAIPGLRCAPIRCYGPAEFDGIDVGVEIYWGGYSPTVTAANLNISRSDFARMKRALVSRYGDPSNVHRESGEKVTEWKLADALIDLYHGDGADKPTVYFEPKRLGHQGR